MNKINLFLLKSLQKLAPIITNDSIYLKIAYWLKFGKALNLQNPSSYNEKLQWLKLYDRKPIYTTMVDKIEAKKYVSNIIGEEFIIPTIAEYNSVDEINWDILPNQFVLKCTHDSGGLIVCKDKALCNKEKELSKLRKALSKTYYYMNREWPYKNVPHRLICEEYLVDESGYELKDYKFFCFDGIPQFLFIASDRGNSNEETKFDFFDMNFSHLPFTNGHPNSGRVFNKPVNFELMKEIASKLSKGIPQLRVDLYNINGKIYFGELTFFHWSGMVPFIPEEWDYKFGSYIKLPTKIND